MPQVMESEAFVLQEDGCYVDAKGIQHYLYPREADPETTGVKLARYEFVWHIHTDWQGQYEEGDSVVECGWEEIESEVEKLEKEEISFQLFPRDKFKQLLNSDWDAIAQVEYLWYIKQKP